MIHRERALGTFLVAVVTLGCPPACQRAVPPVPPTNRTVVQPKGSTDVMKSWNRTTRQEGEAILGPLSNSRR